ncbi:MAG: hypothetical protein B7Z54_01515 [Sphingobacteriales bacterium 12-47-4]|nr:MAG: hypothetical protein B7Z54_01515 [Sphingobacteriales bacterium 12-47-4]
MVPQRDIRIGGRQSSASFDYTLQADDRETSSFKAILHPIYEELIRQIQTSHLFMQGRDFEVKRIDRYYLGRTKVESQLNDYIDAIEVRLSGIKIRKQIC